VKAFLEITRNGGHRRSQHKGNGEPAVGSPFAFLAVCSGLVGGHLGRMVCTDAGQPTLGRCSPRLGRQDRPPGLAGHRPDLHAGNGQTADGSGNRHLAPRGMPQAGENSGVLPTVITLSCYSAARHLVLYSFSPKYSPPRARGGENS